MLDDYEKLRKFADKRDRIIVELKSRKISTRHLIQKLELVESLERIINALGENIDEMSMGAKK
jgi:hypothetical protein